MSDKKGLPSLPSLPKVSKYDEIFSGISPTYSPDTVLGKAKAEVEKYHKDNKYELSNVALVQAMSLREFEMSVLMVTGLTEEMRTFAQKLSLDYQERYKCDDVTRKSLAELSAFNYCRILDTQKRIQSYLNGGSFTDIGVKYIAVLSKELDRAERHYLTSMQALEIGLQQPLSVSIRTNTANIANQQAIQQIQKDKTEYDI